MLSEISDSPKNLKNSTLFRLTESYFNSVKPTVLNNTVGFF
jgi:hypothetical protein